MLLEKFEKIDMDIKKTKLSKEDVEWLSQAEAFYRKKLSVLLQIYALRNENCQYLPSEIKDFRYADLLINNGYDTLGDIDKLQNSYANTIIRHFNEKYDVSLENPIPKSTLQESARYSEYDPLMPLDEQALFISQQDILDSMMEQLDGLNFEDRAVQELKDALSKENCYTEDRWRIRIIKNKLSYSGYTSNDWFSAYSFHNVLWLHLMLDALSYHNYGMKMQFLSASRLYRAFSFLSLEDEDFKTTFDLKEFGVKIKFFKNGRVDFIFSDAQTCRKFAQEWIGCPM